MNEYYNHWLPKLLRVAGVTIGKNIFYSVKKTQVPERLRRHEKEHVKQYEQNGIIKFLFCYFFEYIKNLIKYKSHRKAYLNISFEIAARKAEQVEA